MEGTKLFSIIILVISLSVVSSVLSFSIAQKISLDKSNYKTNEQLIKEYYEIENAVLVSPHGLRKSMDKGENLYTIVDLRSQQEYEKEHIIGAINIPAYKDPNTSAYDEMERIVAEFEKLPKDKEIVVYCYSMACMTGRKVGKALSDKGIYVKHLGIGWNEWRHYWNLWNHELEWETNKVEDYVSSGREPGTAKVVKTDSLTPCSLDDNFGC